MDEGDSGAVRGEPGTAPMEEAARAQEISGRLAAEFTDVEPAHIERLVTNGFGAFSDARVRDFVGVFVERRVRGELRRADPLPRRGEHASGSRSSASPTS